MRSSLRLFRRQASDVRQKRYLSIEAPVKAHDYPQRVGGVHYQEGDRVIATNKDGKRVKSRLLSPLKADSSTTTGLHAYELKHDEIIGQPAGRLYVHASSTSSKEKSTSFRIAHPSLDQFISLAPRTVTPIYSSYGATIVSLLDLHVAPPLPSNDPQTTQISPLEILEAGTGNGGLTLHLSRAVAAANPPPPYSEDDCDEEEIAKRWDAWRSTRRAVVHTVEFAAPRSRAAARLIKSFRGALYWPHIDFHTGDVGDWVKTEYQKRVKMNNTRNGFLDIVILDLPSVHQQIPLVTDATKEDGQLLVWVPQVTQVAACQHHIESLGLPFKLDQVVELGEGISNGRRWDVRFVKTRAEQRKEQCEPDAEISDSTLAFEASDGDEGSVVSTSDAETAQSATEFPTMVCRPMVGTLTMGGGFLGLWRKVTKSNARG